MEITENGTSFHEELLR
jgi:hypothetical protein